MAPAKRDPRVVVSPHYVAQRRIQRRPQHKFSLKLTPYEIQPFLLAPVLPGETFNSAMLQAQAWSDPLKGDLRNIGWWLQWNFFYVRHRDLPGEVRNLLASMLLDPTTDMSSLVDATGDPATYTYPGAIPWSQLCLEHVVNEFFRDEGEEWGDYTGPNDLPLARVYGHGTSDAFEKLTMDSDYEDRRVNLIQNANELYANEMSTMMGHWHAMRDAGLTDMDYQDFMKTYGSTVREDEESPNLHRAEDLWSLREFTYPTNTVEPTTGVPAVSAGWRVQKSGGKRVFCDEPGFIFGVTYCRPKIYFKPQKGSVAGSMSDVRAWLPAMLHDQVDLGHRKFDGADGPLGGVFDDGAEGFRDYWIDLRDLLLYGDQFVNYSVDAETPFLDLPDVGGGRRYAAESEVTKFFAGSGDKFDVDGLCSLTIQGRQKDTTSGLVLGKA